MSPPSLTAEQTSSIAPPQHSPPPPVPDDHDTSPSPSDTTPTTTDDDDADVDTTTTTLSSHHLHVVPSHLPQQHTRFHVTGFKQFYNVPVNPTQLIVDALPHHLRDHPLVSGATVSSTDVFEVAAKTTLRAITTLYDNHASILQQQQQHKRRPRKSSSSFSSSRTVFVHLGVNMSSSQFHLEWQAKNEATFSCPDQLGWTPIRHPIDDDNSDIMFTRKTALDLTAIVKYLRVRNFPVDTSCDAGRFVCNWIYYNSLKLSKENSTDALFVHVPSTAVIPLHTQVEFIAALLDAIALTPE